MAPTLDTNAARRAARGLGAALVSAVHVALVAFVVVAPFSENPTALVLHLVGVPFLWLHWLLNDDTCALTVLERAVRGVDARDSFVHAIVSPVYKIRDDTVRRACWVGSLALWLVTVSRFWFTTRP
jgi:hypothetical protein